jgi:hypothetical protein
MAPGVPVTIDDFCRAETYRYLRELGPYVPVIEGESERLADDVR